MNLYPKPNVTGNNAYNFATSPSATNPRREDIVRIDYQLNGKNRLFGRYIHNADTMYAPYESFPGPFGIFACSSPINFPGGCIQKHPGWNLSVNLVTTIRPNLLNEFSVGPSHTLSEAEGANLNTSRGANGITLPLLFPVDSSQSIPDMNFGGLNGVSFQGPYLGATPWYQKNTTINANDNLSLVLHNHTLKTGFFFQRSRKDQIAWGNVNGQFGFGAGPTGGGTCPVGVTCALGDPLASALIGQFDSFDQSSARPVGRFRYSQAEFYLQDTWKVTQRLTLDYGMRFAWIPPQTDASNQVALFDPNAYNPAQAVQIDPSNGEVINGTGNPLNGMLFTKGSSNLPVGGWNSRGVMPEPRLGFAYDVFGDHKTILRGGFGLMHDRTQGNLIFNTVFNNPALVTTPSIGKGNVTDLPGISTASLESPALSNITGAARNGKVPTVYSFSLGVQREIGKGATLDVSYVGSMARHLVTSRDINAVPYGTAFSKAAQDPNCSLWGGGGVPDVQPGLQPEYAAAGFSYNGWCAYGWQGYTDNYLAPYKGYAKSLSYMQFDGTSNYNSLQASFQRRFSKGLTFGAVYTWSKSLTTATGDQDMQDPFNARLDYRAASWDRTHVFAANYMYDLPNVTKMLNGPKWLSYITDNFQLTGVTQFQTGTPVDSNNNGSFPSGFINGGNQWSAVNYNYTLDKKGNVAFPTIGVQPRGTRDILRQGGLQNWDMSLFKNIPLGEHRALQLRMEGFNAFNHPNFSQKYYASAINLNGPWPWNDPATPFSLTKNSNFGQIQRQSQYGPGPGGPRVLQLGARFTF